MNWILNATLTRICGLSVDTETRTENRLLFPFNFDDSVRAVTDLVDAIESNNPHTLSQNLNPSIFCAVFLFHRSLSHTLPKLRKLYIGTAGNSIDAATFSGIGNWTMP
jgi:hypothetical protein